MPTPDGRRRRPDDDATPLRLAAVLPVRGHSALMTGCLEAIRAQRLPLDEVIVVDDSPTGDLGPLPDARVLRSYGRGPYAARNVGWRSTDADVVLFLDARSRPRPEWSSRMAEAFADPRTVLAGSEVLVVAGAGLGALASERQQFFRLSNYLAKPFYRPYLPTCNLAVRRTALAETGGFEETRSGGDADLCWQVQDAGLGELSAIGDVLMDWIPRDHVREYLEQNYRYGKSNYALRTRWSSRGAPRAAPVPHWIIARRTVGTALRVARAMVRPGRPALVDHLGAAGWLAFHSGYRVAADVDRVAAARAARSTGRWRRNGAPEERSTRPSVAIYRSVFLPRSETFVRDHIRLLPRYETHAVTRQIHSDPLPVRGRQAMLIAPTTIVGRARRKLLNRRASGAVLERDLELALALRTLRPDVVHAHFAPDGAEIVRAARLLRLPLVTTFHGYDATTYPEALARSAGGRLLLSRWDELIATCDAFITVSGFLRDVLVERGVPPRKIHVIACGVEVPPGEPTPVPLDAVVLFVGRMVEKKGVTDLIRALALLPTRVPLHLVGDGPLRPEAEALAEELGIDATFHGTLAPDAVRERMQAATIVAMPSKRAADGDCEGLPVTALEAGVNARPVVGYRHSGIPEAVLDGWTGLLADEGDVEGLGARLAELVFDTERCNAMGRAAREHVMTHFLSKDLLSEVAAVYDDVRAARATRHRRSRRRESAPAVAR